MEKTLRMRRAKKPPKQGRWYSFKTRWTHGATHKPVDRWKRKRRNRIRKERGFLERMKKSMNYH